MKQERSRCHEIVSSSVDHSCVHLTAREKEVGGILKTIPFVEVSVPSKQALGSGLRCRTRSIQFRQPRNTSSFIRAG